MDRYNIAVIGYGGMGSYHVSQLTSISDEFNVCGIYDIDKAKRDKAAQNGFRVYDAIDDLWDDKSVRTVIIAVPNNFHKEISTDAMMHGKNVICEKPVMMNAADLQDVLNVSKKTGMLFAAHQNRRWDKDYLIVKDVLKNGTIGKPFYIESRVQGSKGVPGDWRCVKEAGGGMMLDWGVHLLDQMLLLTDSPVTEVYAHMLSIKFPDVDDNFKLLLRFENGLSALVEVDTYDFIPLPRFHVCGDEGTLQINDFECNGEIVRANRIKMNWEEGIVYTAAGPTRTMAPRPEETIEHLSLPDITTDAKDYYRDFRDADLGGTQPAVKPEEMLRVMKVMDSAFISGNEHRSVSVHI